jgi:lipopolysaccharide export system permease protein
MLKIFDRQMTFSYFKAYFICLVSLMGLFIVIDLFLNLDDFMAQGRDFESLVRFIGIYYGYKSFQIFDRLCEAVVLLAGMFTVAWMQRNNELLPLLSAGVSTRRAVRPVLVCAFTMMGLVAVNQECAMPRIDIWMLEHRTNPRGERETEVKGSHDASGIYLSGNSAIKSEMLVKKFHAVIPAHISGNALVLLQAKEAYYVSPKDDDQRSGGWLLKNVKDADTLVWPKEREDVLKPLGDGDFFLKTQDVDIDTLTRVKNWHLYIPTWELLRHLNKAGNSTQNKYLAVAFHQRLTRPLVGMILILLGLSVILRDQNRNIFISAGFCLMLVGVFFATIFACQYLGRDTLSPALASWLPVFIFGPVSLVMFDAVHT